MRNALKLGTAVGLLLLIPTGTPDDLIIPPYLIARFGYPAYIMIVLSATYILYHSTNGKTLKDKVRAVKQELKQVF